MDSEGDYIQARFWMTTKNLSMYVKYEGVALTMKWPREKDGTFDKKPILTLIGNMPDLIKDCLDEVIVQEEAKGLQAEIEELFGEQDGDDQDDHEDVS